MKSSEILGALRDLVDQIAQGDETPAVNVYPAEKRFVSVDVPKTPEDLVDKEHDKELPLDTMVPPLQQKIELLKRAVDIDNVFDGTPIDKTTNGEEDYKQEIQAISRNAGISPVVLDAAGDDEPLDV
jgi:hypothetical protein